MQSKEVIVIKFGTASITDSNGNIDEKIIETIAQQVAYLHANYSVVLVSSGAVGAGKGRLKDYKGTLIERKAAAAVGNPLLLAVYGKYFQKYGISLAQSLCERQHFANREQFLQLKETYQELWRNGIIPIANENDVVSNLELKFSDNDELATLIAAGFGAKYLLFSTSVGGVYDDQKKIIPFIETIDSQILQLANKEKTAVGLGGMISKLNFARKAVNLGIKVVIFGIHTPNGIIKAIEGETGTAFKSIDVNLSAKQRWMGTGSLVSGVVTVDSGAEKALLDRKSLLVVGVLSVDGEFEAHEIIEIQSQDKKQLAVAKIKYSSVEINQNLKTQNFEIAHANDIVLL